MNAKEFFETPQMMEFFGNQNNLIAFLRFQANIYDMASSPQVSLVARELYKCADEIECLVMKGL